VGLISNATALGLLAACERCGVSRELVLGRAGLDATRVAPEARLSEQELFRLWSAALELSRNDDLSLLAAEASPPGAYGVVDFLLSHAPTLGEGLARAARYFSLIHTGVRLATLEGPEECALDVGHHPDPVAARPAGEFSLAMFALRLRQNAGADLSFVRVECAYPEPHDRRELDRFFASPLRFGAASNRLVLSKRDWDRQPLKSEPELFRVLEDHARRVEEELPDDSRWAAQVRKLVAEELKGGRPLASHVAKRLGMSERSLQRRLKEEGENFSLLLDELRARHAAVYLKDKRLSQVEVAHLLGFSDVSAFHRAHRRWRGKPPGAA
jgi:AraC-like DNA-binding protein